MCRALNTESATRLRAHPRGGTHDATGCPDPEEVTAAKAARHLVAAFMKKRASGVSFGIALWLLLHSACLLSAIAQQNPVTLAPTQTQPASGSQESPKEDINAPGQVVIEGRPILTVYETVGGLTPQDRASGIEKRILAVAQESGSSPESIRVESRSTWTEIFSDKQLLLAVTDVDAKMAGKPRPQLTSEYAENIRQAIRNYHEEHSWRIIFSGVVKTLLATLALVPFSGLSAESGLPYGTGLRSRFRPVRVSNQSQPGIFLSPTWVLYLWA